mmetsp:Transcript_6466/g.19098  ORF Transcript_6466/g.19098 Transcript_6466/m.19098 type:complete len:226 (+) Transcript_6466:101-778(+)
MTDAGYKISKFLSTFGWRIPKVPNRIFDSTPGLVNKISAARPGKYISDSCDPPGRALMVYSQPSLLTRYCSSSACAFLADVATYAASGPTSVSVMMRSTRPCKISNPDVGPAYTAATLRTFLAPTRVWVTTCSASATTTSLISKSLKPFVKDADLLCCNVLRSPGRRVVRTTWYSTLAGLESETVVSILTGHWSAVKLSWMLQSPCVSTSMYPARAISSRSRSPS